MDIELGAEVIGADGAKLGEISRVIADAGIDRVTDVVIKHGAVFGREWVVPLRRVRRVEDGRVHLDISERDLKSMSGFAGPQRADDTDYAGTPSDDLADTYRGNLTFDSYVAGGGRIQGKPLGFPGGEQLTPDIMDRPAIYPGIDVLDALGEKVGELGAFAFAQDTGTPTRVSVKHGRLFKHETPLPLAWVTDLTDDGVLLAVPGREVEALDARRHGR